MLKDHLGSPVRTVDDRGTAATVARYDPWGLRLSAAGVPVDLSDAREVERTRSYTGHELIASARMHHMNGRIHDSVVGLFIGPDRCIQGRSIASLNRFALARNRNPNREDPSGWMDTPGIGIFKHVDYHVARLYAPDAAAMQARQQLRGGAGQIRFYKAESARAATLARTTNTIPSQAARVARERLFAETAEHRHARAEAARAATIARANTRRPRHRILRIEMAPIEHSQPDALVEDESSAATMTRWFATANDDSTGVSVSGSESGRQSHISVHTLHSHESDFGLFLFDFSEGLGHGVAPEHFGVAHLYSQIERPALMSPLPEMEIFRYSAGRDVSDGLSLEGAPSLPDGPGRPSDSSESSTY